MVTPEIIASVAKSNGYHLIEAIMVPHMNYQLSQLKNLILMLNLYIKLLKKILRYI